MYAVSVYFSPRMWSDPCNKCGEPTDYTCYLIDIDLVTILLGVVLIAGSVLAFSPQIIKFIKTKEVQGVSFFSLWLGSVNNWSCAMNFYMSQFPGLVACQNDLNKCLQNNIP